MSTLSPRSESRNSLLSNASERNHSQPPSLSPSSGKSVYSAASSKESLKDFDDENVTITSNRVLSAKRQSHESLRLLAISTNLTELSYSISDIQTRIFEIQELRHMTQSANGDASSVDQALSNLDERLQAVAQGMKAVNESLDTIVRTPTQSDTVPEGEDAVLLRKHAALVTEWETVRKESDMLREELREDKWLTVFRTVTEQADGMMASLEKAVNRCQDFIQQVQHRDDWMSRQSSSSSLRAEKPTVNFEVFTSLSDSFEAKKKHYMPATSKVLSILDKGVQDRVTKNGECLRRHAESTQRWQNLRARIQRTDTEMEYVRKLLSHSDRAPSDAGSSASGHDGESRNGSSRHGDLVTPSRDRADSKAGSISRSISPFRKLARKLKVGSKSPQALNTPLAASNGMLRTPSSEPVPTLRHRKTLFSLSSRMPPSPITPDRPSHKYSQSQSLRPETPSYEGNSTIKNRPRWDSSTKVDERVSTIKASPQRRPSNGPPPAGSPYKRSLSRTSVTSSSLWTPSASSGSNATSPYRPPSRTQRPPSRTQRPPSRNQAGPPPTPRSRPRTPSHIPQPSYFNPGKELQDEYATLNRSFSPSLSVSASSQVSSSVRPETPGGTLLPTARPPSRSMIPIPKFSFSPSSRPGSTMSNYRPDSAMSMNSASAAPPQKLSRRLSQLSFFNSSNASVNGQETRGTPRPSTVLTKLPPSSYRESSRTPAPGTSRPASRGGARTPVYDGEPLHRYTPASTKDPLDVEVAAVVNSIAHGFLVERIDPPLRGAPREGEEVRAQYAFSTQLNRKVINCKLTTMTRPSSSGRTKKVMCRVGGGWQDLQVFITSKQAGW